MQIDWTAVLGRFALGVGTVAVVAVLGALAFGIRGNEMFVVLEARKLRIGFSGAPEEKGNQADEAKQAKRGKELGGAPEQDAPRPVYQVVGVDDDDTLAVRVAADPFSQPLAWIPPSGRGVVGTGKQKKYGRDTWLEVRWETVRGWVNSYYLEPLAPAAGTSARKIM